MRPSSLEELSLVYMVNTPYSEHYTDSCSKLDAPCLRRLTIDFDTEDKQWESPEAFGPGEVRWIREFLSTQAAEFPHSRLSEISVIFQADLWDCVTAEEDYVWPWDYLDEAADIVDLRP
ncbi:hypothetical protein VTN00DRAFT_2352 [Thermoascus crustaceus]|uniref:uncharacterized protein n=1 Tax=Thermoascus crustaceus TaxID=5088 RepID=UPI003742D05A